MVMVNGYGTLAMTPGRSNYSKKSWRKIYISS